MCIGVRTRTTVSILSYTWTAIKYVYRACISNTPLKPNDHNLDCTVSINEPHDTKKIKTKTKKIINLHLSKVVKCDGSTMIEIV